MFCTNLWKIWNTRNYCLSKNKPFEPYVVADRALDSVMEFNKNNLELRSKKQMVHVNGMNPHDHGLNVIQVDASRF